ncbi:TonB-dependent receptor [Paraflavitalea sp. CAU 1676]|uniref:TonB-dependent receptor n=1 Tax=Paraflavitalea sp. CAU 1676 TaxID=3032598 RepID=UPI0023DA89C0|nr:TonB-dependent receptor [Paraflavitalea sp. CAU 1676]MDF2191673.1 TonB-dependent receptor [Paraflavitalea sp. CAU 1676]
MRSLLLILLLCCTAVLFAQSGRLEGLVKDKTTSLPLEGATITLVPGGQQTVSDERGRFSLNNVPATSELVVTAIGHARFRVRVGDLASLQYSIALAPTSVELSQVTVSSGAGEQFKPISKLDIKLRGINNSQEVLRMVPGLFIGQHAGGGKAEQIFLRGFDIDHGTDINIGVDGMPVNMVSHAHGQGYADLHFLIPELIDNVTFKKGTYYAEKGNFTTTGFVDFKTMNVLPNNSVKVEGGMFNTARAVGMFNLLGKEARANDQSAYIASEYMHTKGYFDNPQDFHRINVFGKYFGALNKRNHLSVSASVFSSKWDASGQVPDRAVDSKLIGWYGAIDPHEGGNTSRINANAQLTTTLDNHAYLKNQVYYSRYGFELFSNFTFFKEDPVNGDQIRQQEKRDLFGYNGSYHTTFFAGNTQIISELGAHVRMDRTHNSELSRTKDRTILTNGLMLGDISENNLAAYVSETFRFNSRFSINAGLRYDYFQDEYTDQLNGSVKGKASADIVSPKLSFYYNPSSTVQLYLSSGKGFHSNDTRVVVPQNGLTILPSAYGSDLGTVLKPVKNLLVNAAVWYLWLDQEFVYVGDEGVVEPSGRSRRYGADLSVRYQPLSWLYADVDFNYAHGRAVDEPKGEDYLPLAPRFTSIGGLTVKTKPGINASLRYRYMGNRPANEDNSVVANGYFITDAFVGYNRERYEIGLAIQNLFDVKWKETQFDTESRLYNEAAPISEIHFTPGTPFFAKLSFTYLF